MIPEYERLRLKLSPHNPPDENAWIEEQMDNLKHPEPAGKETEVVDLVAALRASVEAAKNRREAQKGGETK